MLHFFYGIPRLIFLTAPLAYLFFGAHVIQESALMIAAMALPHLSHANQVNSRVQGQFRHSFWAEVYEAVLAWYIFRPTLYAVINPKAGKFNVTAKGGYIERDYFRLGHRAALCGAAEREHGGHGGRPAAHGRAAVRLGRPGRAGAGLQAA